MAIANSHKPDTSGSNRLQGYPKGTYSVLLLLDPKNDPCGTHVVL